MRYQNEIAKLHFSLHTIKLALFHPMSHRITTQPILSHGIHPCRDGCMQLPDMRVTPVQ
jgi:hypothetical protein